MGTAESASPDDKSDGVVSPFDNPPGRPGKGIEAIDEPTAQLQRRAVLVGSLSGFFGLLLGFFLDTSRREAVAQTSLHSPNAWIKIDTNNSITVLCPRSEMGQGAYTAIPLLIAEELGIDVNKVRVEFAPPAEVYINALLGGQLTAGSTSVRDAWEKCRKAGASARIMLVTAAANRWNVAAESCRTQDGTVFGPGGRRASYGELASSAVTLPVPTSVTLKPVSEFTQIGKSSLSSLDTPAKVAGTATFGIDVRVPSMLYAAVLMPPTIGGKARRFDATRARSLAGVHAVVEYSRGIAVVADSTWNAIQARGQVDVSWESGPAVDMNSVKSKLTSGMRDSGSIFRAQGDADIALKQAANVFESVYEFPFLAHAPLEPMNAVADVRASKAILILPTQFQQLVPFVVAGATGLKPEDVTVISTFIGGGFGRRIEVDCAIDAAEISKAVKAPVKVTWTREDDFTHDSYRPAGLVRLALGVDVDRRVTAFRAHSSLPSVSSRLFPSIVKDGIDPFSVEGLDNMPYAFKTITCSHSMQDVGVTPGYHRGKSHGINVVALECFVEEVARTLGRDPLQFRLDHLDFGETKHAWSGLSAGIATGFRVRRVLEEIRRKSSWGQKFSDGTGQGLAVCETMNAVIACVARVSVDSARAIAVQSLVYVVDAGPLVHPTGALKQIEGGALYGVSVCLGEEITVQGSRVREDNFDKYTVLRMKDVPPDIAVHWVPASAGQPPAGLGEVSVAVTQAAVANAVQAASGIKVRRFPLMSMNSSGASVTASDPTPKPARRAEPRRFSE